MNRDAEENDEIIEKQKLFYGFIAKRNSEKKWEMEFSYRGFIECKL